MSDDDDIRAAVRRGDDAAFDLLVDRYQDLLFDRARIILRDDGLAEDAVQTTMLKVLMTRDSLDEVRDLRAWLVTVVSNTARDTLRGDKRARLRVERLRECCDADDVAVPPDLGNEHGDRDGAALQQCLDELDGSIRAVLVRRYEDGAAWEEIARELGLAVDAARMRVRRATKALKRCLDRKEAER